MHRLTTLLLGLALMLPACGGGGDSIVAVIGGLLGTAGCTADGIEGFSEVFDQIEIKLGDNPVPGSLNITVGSGGSTLNIVGTVTEVAGDLSDGFQVGDTAQFNLTSITFGSSVAGSAVITTEYANATSILVSGTLSLDDGSCTVSFTDVALDLDPTDDDDYGTGSVNFTTTAGGDTLAGNITLNGSPVANVVAALNGGNPTSFDIDLDTYDVAFP